MDATWFAVDQDGHIGMFDSGEAGAVPAEVNDTIGQSDDAVLEALEPLPVIGEPRFDLSGMFHPGLRSGALPKRRVLPRGWPSLDEAQSLLLSDESPLTPEVRALPGLEVDRVGQFVLVSLKASVELARHDPRWKVWDQFTRVVGARRVQGLLLSNESPVTPEVRALPGVEVDRVGLFVLVSLEPSAELTQHDPRWKVWDEFKRVVGAGPFCITSAGRPCITSIALFGPELTVARRGLFAYSAHDARFNLPEPYGLVLAPQQPLRLDQVPRRLRDVLVTRARLNVSFTSSLYVQPAEHVPCAVWAGIVYLASDGFTVRPLPGSDAAAYDSAAKQLRHASPEEELRYRPVVFDRLV